jgi:hypothetical protein
MNAKFVDVNVGSQLQEITNHIRLEPYDSSTKYIVTSNFYIINKLNLIRITCDNEGH